MAGGVCGKGGMHGGGMHGGEGVYVAGGGPAWQGWQGVGGRAWQAATAADGNASYWNAFLF